ncbi:MAG: hypothetical protein GF350_11970, partial [Chitinivibrionales bacterium]|nr:hypothetical protein [Chitinivibrionales bacterium]
MKQLFSVLLLLTTALPAISQEDSARTQAQQSSPNLEKEKATESGTGTG